jgi:hypothetical protein
MLPILIVPLVPAKDVYKLATHMLYAEYPILLPIR